MKEAAVELAAKGKGTSKAEGANDGKKRFEVKKVCLRHHIYHFTLLKPFSGLDSDGYLLLM